MVMFDQVARRVCKLDGIELFAWILRDDSLRSYRFHTWDDTRRQSLPGQPDRTNDVVALLKPDSPEEPLARGIVEVQTEPDRLIFARLGIYELLLFQELAGGTEEPAEPPIFSVLINLTGENPVDGWTSILGRHAVRPIVLNLKNASASELLRDIEASQLGLSLLPWLPLMDGGGDDSLIAKWKELAGRETDVEHRRQYRDFALIFAELSKKLVLWQKALEDWEMLESQLILGWRKQGEDKGKVEKARADVLRVIELRFQKPVPEDLMLAIEGTNDETILDLWLEAAIVSSAISDLRKIMKKS